MIPGPGDDHILADSSREDGSRRPGHPPVFSRWTPGVAVPEVPTTESVWSDIVDPDMMDPEVVHPGSSGPGVPDRRSRPEARGDVPEEHASLDELLSENAVGRPGRQPVPGSATVRLAGLLPRALRGGLVDPSLRGALLLAIVVLVAALATGWFAWQSRAVPVTTNLRSGSNAAVASADREHGGADGTGPRPNAAWSPAGATRSPTAQIVVDVVGKVHRPGVVTLPAGSRVMDAVAQAGGVLPGLDTSGLALARRLVDGEQILVDGRPGPAPPQPVSGGSGGGGARSSAAAPATPLNLNTASVEAIDGLPGVGPVLAQRIVEWREAHGGFTSTRQLGEVTGVGDKRLADLLPFITV